MARTRKEIDPKIFEALCRLQCTRNEICSFLDITDKTLNAWCKRTYGEDFSAVFAKKREGGKISLRRAQFRLAEKNAAMAIFLGKQYLGQSDDPKPEAAAQNSDGFLEALSGSAAEDWKDESEEEDGGEVPV